MMGRLSAIGHCHRRRTGIRPIGATNRVRLMTKELRMAKGHAARKLPLAAEDMAVLKGHRDLAKVDRLIFRRTTLITRFYMVRVGGYSPPAHVTYPAKVARRLWLTWDP